ncbi:hypothetical protein Pres01_42050 [Metapseudomonas resinovorans]|nr:hypothetical protein Pres01_42050 [Pseudomonas resinovorans]
MCLDRLFNDAIARTIFLVSTKLLHVEIESMKASLMLPRLNDLRRKPLQRVENNKEDEH